MEVILKTGYYERELERQAKAKETAKADGFEAITPQGAMTLFGISDASIRRARLERHVTTKFTLAVSGKSVHLLDLQSAVAYWAGKRRLDFDEVLDKMRREGQVIGLNGIAFNVLHVEPIIKWEDVETE